MKHCSDGTLECRPNKKGFTANAVNPSMLVAGAGFEPTTFGL